MQAALEELERKKAELEARSAASGAQADELSAAVATHATQLAELRTAHAQLGEVAAQLETAKAALAAQLAAAQHESSQCAPLDGDVLAPLYLAQHN